METAPCLLDFANGLAPPPPMSAEEAAQFAQLEALAQELYTTQDAQRRVFAQNALESAVAAHADANGNSGNYSAMLGKCLIFLKHTKSQYLSVNTYPHYYLHTHYKCSCFFPSSISHYPR